MTGLRFRYNHPIVIKSVFNFPSISLLSVRRKFLGVYNSFIVLKHRDTTIISFSMILVLLQALLELCLQSFFTIHGRLSHLILLLLLIRLQRTFVCVVAFLLTIKADNSHILHLTHRIHHLNITQLLLCNLLFLTIGRFVTFASAPMTYNLSLILSHIMVLSTMH